jgi:para-nitrobenzyl esterase
MADGPPPILARAEQAGAKITADLGAASLADLRHMPAEAVNAAANSLLMPVIDGYTIPTGMFEAFGAQKQNDVPLLVGSTDGEADNFSLPPLSTAKYVETIRAQFGDLANEILKVYPAGSDEELVRSRRRLARDGETGWAMWTWARLQSANGRGKVFQYYFAQRPSFPPGSPMFDWGAAHGSELFYVFGNYAKFDWPWTEHDRQLSEAMTTYWTNFAKTGDPNGTGVPEWPAFNRRNERVLRIGAEIAPVDLPNRAGIELLNRRATKAREQLARSAQ